MCSGDYGTGQGSDRCGRAETATCESIRAVPLWLTSLGFGVAASTECHGGHGGVGVMQHLEVAPSKRGLRLNSLSLSCLH